MTEKREELSDGMVVGVDPANGNQCVIGVVQSFNAAPNRNGDVYVLKGTDTKQFVSGKKTGKLKFRTTEVIGEGYGNFDGIKRLWFESRFPKTPFDNLTRRRPWSMGRLERLFREWGYR